MFSKRASKAKVAEQLALKRAEDNQARKTARRWKVVTGVFLAVTGVVRGLWVLRFRHRRQLAPFWVLAGLWVAGFAATGVAPPGVLILALLGAGAVLFRLRGALNRRVEQVYALTGCGLAVVWLVVCAALGDTRADWVGIVVWAGFAVPWWRHHAVRVGDTPSVVVDGTLEQWWINTAEAFGSPWPESRMIEVTPINNGVTCEIVLPPGKLATSDAVAKAGRIASARERSVATTLVEPTRTQIENRFRLTLLERSRVDAVHHWPGPQLDPTTGLAPAGPYADQGVGYARFWRPGSGPTHWMVCGCTDGGKALDLHTPVPTPSGWSTMGALRVGDELFDESGQVCRVTEAFATRYGRPCYDVVFSDGERITADGEHLWWTESRQARISRRRDATTRRRAPRLTEAQCGSLRELATGRTEVTLREVSDATGLSFVNGFVRRVAADVGPVRRWTTQAGTTRHAHTYPASDLIERMISEGVQPVGDQRSNRVVGRVRTTEDISRTLDENHSIPVAGPLDLPPTDLPVPPYVLGCWLGDGSSAGGQITTPDPEVLDFIRQDGFEVGPPFGSGDTIRTAPTYTIYGLQPHLRSLDLISERGHLSEKHIPAQYLRGSLDQRRALLAGLLDTDGTVSPAGGTQYDSMCERLAYGVLELALALGYRATITTKDATLNGRVIGPTWRIAFTTSDSVFRLPRKRDTLAGRCGNHNAHLTGHRYITAVQPVPTRPVRCIAVDSPSRLFLAGRHMVPTHNSRFLDWTLLESRHSGLIASWVGDPQGGQSLPAWRTTAHRFEDTPEGISDMLRDLEAEMDARSRDYARREWTDEDGNTWVGVDHFTPTPEDPIIELVLDEAQDITVRGSPELAILEKVARKSRKTGIRMVLSTQMPSVEQLGGSMTLRGQVLAGCVASLRTAENVTKHMVLPPSFPVNPYNIPRETPEGETTAGTMYMYGPQPRPVLLRNWLVPNAHAAAAAAPTIPLTLRSVTPATVRPPTQPFPAEQPEDAAGQDTVGAANIRDAILGLDWVTQPEKRRGQIVTELKAAGYDYSLSAVQKALGEAGGDGGLEKVSHGLYRLTATQGAAA